MSNWSFLIFVVVVASAAALMVVSFILHYIFEVVTKLSNILIFPVPKK